MISQAYTVPQVNKYSINSYKRFACHPSVQLYYNVTRIIILGAVLWREEDPSTRKAELPSVFSLHARGCTCA